VRVSEKTEGAVIPADIRGAEPSHAAAVVRVLVVCAVVWAAAGCAADRKSAATPPPPARRVVVESSDGRAIHASVEADASRGGTPFPAKRDPAAPDLAERPASRPASLPPPKIIPDGEKATLIYPCRHAETETLRAAVEVLLSPEGAVHASAALNSIVVSDRATLIQSLLEVLQELDAPNNQLLVEARVVEVSATRDFEAEIRHAFTAPAGASTFLQNSAVNLGVPGAATANQGLDVGLRVFDEDGKMLDSFFRLLNTRGRARVLSSPNLIVAPGQEASIITGEEVPVQSSTIAGGSITTATQFKRVGIKLRVTLLQLTNDMARLEINPEVSTVTGFTAAAEGQPANPIIAIRNVTSTLSLKDGEILTVGGLLRNEKRRTTRGVPFLEDIPVAGLLFQSRFDSTVRTQLIFFLRVRIISSGEAEAIRAHRPGAGLNVLDPITDPPSLPQGEGRLPPNLKANQ
jgi:type II secretory pathway component GspD/PulD (secretin)